MNNRELGGRQLPPYNVNNIGAIDHGKTKDMPIDPARTLLNDINVLCKDTAAKKSEEIVKFGGEAGMIPQPQTDRERLMFAAGQLSLALFLQGATTE